jgi:hypothetical protein
MAAASSFRYKEQAHSRIFARLANQGVIAMALIANRYWILLALFAAAAVSYSVGFIAGFGLFVAVGVVFELAFWHQLIKRKRRP